MKTFYTNLRARAEELIQIYSNLSEEGNTWKNQQYQKIHSNVTLMRQFTTIKTLFAMLG